ncbi:MAG: TIGR00341 family protein [Trueperaceae bacterium]|nr:TIGR00341 family protein [Trueperaceae bacterium]
MPLRVLEAFLPDTSSDVLKEIIGQDAYAAVWQEQPNDTGLSIKMIMTVDQTEKVLDVLEYSYANIDRFRVVLLPVEATLPRIEDDPADTSEQNGGVASNGTTSEPKEARRLRISREELYIDIISSTKFNAVYIATIVLSALVAAVGLVQDSVAIIIGAMVIAPLLGPNVALAFATTLGDLKLGRSALFTSFAGLAISLGIAVLLGFVLTVDPTVDAIASRTAVGFPDMVLALASGSAGVLAFTSGASFGLVGVMVAVALMPPLVVCGLLLGAGDNIAALGAFLLVITNVICVNLAGVITFVVQGVRPRRWLEATKARRMTRFAFVSWLLLLGVLIVVVTLSEVLGLS